MLKRNKKIIYFVCCAIHLKAIGLYSNRSQKGGIKMYQLKWKTLDGVEHVANYVLLYEAKGQAKRFTKDDWAFLLAVAVVDGAGKVIYRRHAKEDK